jgi:hypothetical protein
LLLSELAAGTSRLALVGLAKNTGKTETLAAMLRELEARHAHVGVTSIGRDGEARDVIDSRIAKPRVTLAAGSIVATTDALLRASGLPHELLERSGVRTPLGEVVLARLHGHGPIEVAGPSAAADVRAVSDAMLSHGAEQVLIDGAIDRRAASSPQVADALVVCTGAVLGAELEEVVEHTRAAVELARLPAPEGGEPPPAAAAEADGSGVLVNEDGAEVALPARFVLEADPERIGGLLDEHPRASSLVIGGALTDTFLRALLAAARRRRRELTLVASDPTRVFLADRGPRWYERQGLRLRALRAIELLAITVNPVAPHSHRLDSSQLRGRLEAAIPGVPVFDVLDPSYAGPGRRAPA